MLKQKQRNNKQKRSSRSIGNGLIRLLEQTNVRYSPGRQIQWDELSRVQQVVIPAALQTYTLSAGSLAANLALDPTARIDNWASRWAAVFKQYVVLAIEIYAAFGTIDRAQGQIFVRVEEDFAAPTSVITRQEHGSLSLASAQDDKARCCMIHWKPSSAEDWTWTSTGSGYTPSYFKAFASSATTGSNGGDSTTNIQVQVVYRMGFRYLA